MTTDHEIKAGLKEKAIHELKEYLMIFLFLAMFFCTFTAFRRIVLRDAGISYYHYGFALIQALVLAKVILIGQYAKLGRIFDDRPLIIPTLYKVVVFSMLTIAFALLEKLIEGWIHGKDLSGIWQQILSADWNLLLGKALVVLCAFIPFFAVTEIGRVLGENKLEEMFFHRSSASKLKKKNG